MTTSTHQDINALLAGQGTTRRIPTWARWTAGLLIVAVGAYVLTTRARSASLRSLRVHMLSLSASGINLTMLVDGDQVAEAMRRLHAEFFSGPVA